MKKGTKIFVFTAAMLLTLGGLKATIGRHHRYGAPYGCHGMQHQDARMNGCHSQGHHMTPEAGNELNR